MVIKRIVIITLLIMQICLTVIGGVIVGYFLNKENINPALKIGDEIFINLSEEEIYSELSKLFNTNVIISDKTIPIDFDESREKILSWVREKYSNNQPQNIITGMIGYLNPFWKLEIYPYSLINDDEAKRKFKNLKLRIDKDPIPASLVYKNNVLAITPGKEGLTLNPEKTLQGIYASGLSTNIYPVIDKSEASPTVDDLSLIKDKIGDYTTYFNPREEGRTNNIILSANAIDGQLIPPNGIFSFNFTVGERAKEKGYKPAEVYTDNTTISDYGGGVCQTSSTLYQAVRQGKLDIVERHQHTLPIDYVPKQGDATVYYGKLDFKFKNDTKSYLLISAETGKDYLRVRLFALSDEQHPVILAPESFSKGKLYENFNHK